ncbi:MAG: 1,4-alpha-glucan branching protein GlgB [Pirellulaceae bacterium]|nr:1,4-alpha-glucan branching protein GlgB [Pirellulaceae bacterium]
MRTSVSLQSVGALIDGNHPNPFEVLGPHEVQQDGRKVLAVRAFLPHSRQAWVLDQAHDVSRPMRRIHPAGLYEAICPLPSSRGERYQLRVADQNGNLVTMHDPYSFGSLWSDFDRYLFGEGRHTRVYERMGAQLRTIDGVSGTNFSVWAPNARGISVVGDFNGWDGRMHPMRKLVPSGIWEIFVPQVGAGQKYKFRVRTCDGEIIDKSDPYGFAAELPPHTASLVTDPGTYAWGDQQWLERRRQSDPLHQPISVFEVHLGSWQRQHDRQHGWLNYRELAHQLVDYCRKLGFTHIELLPVSEHPFTGSWGYQTVGYYSVTSRYGTPDDFKYFVDYCHQHNLGVIIDWVPAHFPRDGHGLRRFDGSALYEHADPRQGEHPDWGTMIFNYGRNEVRNFLVANALFWLDEYHIDGLRVDAVASMLYLDYSRQEGQWIPNRYGGRENLEAIHMIREFNEQVHAEYPGVLTIAEESTAWGGVSRPTYTGGLGFTLKWNMGWMNDTLRYMRLDSIHRRYHHDELTFSLIYAFTENFVLPLSHDEVVHGKGSLLGQMAGDLWQKFANLRSLYSYLWTHPGKKLLFMGSEFGQWNEWNCDADLQWDLLQWQSHRGVQQLVADLNAMYVREPSLHQLDFEGQGFEWIDCHNREDSVLSYLRFARNPADFLVVCCNFTPIVRHNFRLGVPRGGWYQEIFNSDSEFYGGSNVGNHPGVQAVPQPHHGRPCSLSITVPPLAVVVFKPSG